MIKRSVKQKVKKTTVGAWIPVDMCDEILLLIENLDISMSKFINRALKSYIIDLKGDK